MFRRGRRGSEVQAEAPWKYSYTRGEVERQRALNYALFAVPLTLLGVAYGYLPRAIEKFGWTAIFLPVVSVAFLGLVVVRDISVRRSARIYEYADCKEDEDAEMVAT